MSNDEAEKAARKYASGYGHGATIPKRMHKDICDGIEFVQHVAFLAGREHFIDHELPKLLELARDGIGTESLYNDYTHTIEEIVAMTKKESTE